jgi:hypothetical protein
MFKFLFDMIISLKKPNFHIFSIKKVRPDFTLESTEELSGNCIVEYKYNSKKLLYFLRANESWPPKFKCKSQSIKNVTCKEFGDITERVKLFAGPLQREFEPISVFPVKRRFLWRFKFPCTFIITFGEYLVQTNSVVITR